MKNLALKPYRFFKKLSFKKKLAFLILMSLVLFMVFRSLSNPSSSNTYATVKVSKDTIVETVTETGTITAGGRTDLYSPTNGIVEEVLVANGNMVTDGQSLFTIRSTATEQEQAQALASYMAAKNAVDTANSTLISLQAAMFSAWEEHKTLAESDEYENSDGSPRHDKRSAAQYHIAEKNWLAAESRYKKQQAVIAQAQTALSSAYLAYQATQHAEIKATANGTISNISISVGHSVSANSPASPQTPLATISNDSTTEVVIFLSENDIVKVHPGQPAEITVNAVQNQTYSGVIARVDSIGTLQQGVIRYRGYIEVTDADNRLRPGMNADAVITTNKVEQVLSVPNAAVKPYQGKRAVRISDSKGKIIYVPVEIGIRGKVKTQILKGIQEGQAVITSLTNDQIKRPGLFGN